MGFLQPRSQGFSLLNWVGGKGKSPGNEVGFSIDIYFVSVIRVDCS